MNYYFVLSVIQWNVSLKVKDAKTQKMTQNQFLLNLNFSNNKGTTQDYQL